jgi:hypothetical protein
MTRKWPQIVCPHCSTGYSRMEYVLMQRISTHGPGITPQKGMTYKRPSPPDKP